MNDTKPLKPLVLLRREDMSFPGPWEASLLGHMILTYQEVRVVVDTRWEGVPSQLVPYGQRSGQEIALLHVEGGLQRKRWLSSIWQYQWDAYHEMGSG